MKRLEMAGRRGETETLGTSGRFSFHDRSDRDDSGALVTSAINRSLLAGAGTGTSRDGSRDSRSPALAGILVTESRRGRRRALAIVFRDEPEVIGCDGGPGSDDEGEELPDGDDDELAEPSEVLTAEERAFLNLTKRNTDFNSINSNLTGASRTLVDWVDENDRTTERSALTGRHKKFTPMVSVAPFSTGRGPGPLKINPVAPMQNGEVVSTGRIQEMVEKRSVPDRVSKREQQVTRLDDKVTRLDDKVTRLDDKENKVARLDDKNEEVTRIDDKIIKSDEVIKLDDNVSRLDDEITRKEDEKSNLSEEGSDDAPDVKKTDPAPLKTKTISVVKHTDVKSSSNTGSKSVTEGTSQQKSVLGSRVSGSVNVEQQRPVHRRSAADRSSGSAAAVESGDVGGEPAPSDTPVSNIDMIKARLAEKAAQNGPSSWRSPGKHPERNRARLNSLDGVSKSPKLRSHRRSAEAASGAAGEADKGRAQSSARAADAESRTPACDRVTETPAAEQPTGGNHKNGPDTGRQHLSDGDRSAGSASTEAAAGDEEKLTGTGVKPAPDDHKPPIVNDKPKLAAKPGKVKALGQPAGRDDVGRRSSREVGVAQPTAASPKTAESRVKTDMGNDSKSGTDSSREKPAVNLLECPVEPDKLHCRLAKGQSDDAMSHDMPAEDSHVKSSYSPKTSIHKHTETKPVETKTQRAMKREKELERQREELEKKNREEKKASAPTERRPSLTPQEPEPSISSTRRDSPPSVDAPPSPHASNVNGSGLYSQLQQADRRRTSRDVAPPPRPAHQPSPRSETRAEPPQPEPASQRSSFSTDDDDEDDDEPPAPPQRTVSVSPRSRRKRGGGVSFAPDTEDKRSSGVKPRSQSMPRPGALDQRLGRDEGIRGRLSGNGNGEERRSRRDEPRSRARFSLKKFLKFGRDEKRKERDQVYGEFRAKPEIIHPIDRAGVGCVQVIGRPSDQRRREEVEQRHRRDRLDGGTGHDGTTTAVSSQQTPPRLPERQSHPGHPSHPGHHGHPSHASHRISTGLTPEGRPKPPPPPPPSGRQSSDPVTPPTRPPPPNPHLLSRSRDGWARPPDSDYANLGVSRAGLTPKKPGRGSRSRERVGSSSSEQQQQPLQAGGPEDGLRRQQPCRLSLRQTSACSPPPASLADSYDAVTASNRQALRQLWEQMALSVPPPLLSLQAAPPSLRDFQVAPRSPLPIGRHMFVEAVHGGRTVALCLTAGLMAAAPLSVPAVTEFTDSVPTQLLAGSHGKDGSQVIGTVHVIPAGRVQPLSVLLSDPPPVTSDTARRQLPLLLLLQTVQQLQLLAAAGQLAFDERLSLLVALTADWSQQPRLAAVLSPPSEPPGPGLSPCLAALSVLLQLLGVSDAGQRARDGRGVSSVPDGPDVTAFELLASLLQRDDADSLRRAAAVLGCLLWAPAGLPPAEASRWLHRQRAALLGAAVRSGQPLDTGELLRLGFLAETEPETVADALELINI